MKKYGDKVGMGCVQERYVQNAQATPTYISLHVVYLYASSLNQSECICNAVTKLIIVRSIKLCL